MAKINYTIKSENELGKSTREFEIEIASEILDQYIQASLKEITATTEHPGFRKGKVPEKIILEKVGDKHVLERAADNIVNETVFAILAEKQLRFIGQPSIAVTKLAKGNPFHFKITVSLVPDITLPDYKKIASEINGKKQDTHEVTEKEIEEALSHIKKILLQQKQAGGDKGATFDLNDETVKQLGNFGTLTEFKEKLKNDLLTDKKNRGREKLLLEIIESIVAKTEFEVPEALIEHELDRMESEFAHDVERMGMKKEQYFEKIKKTPESLRKEWRPNAEKRAKFELILPKIAKTENILIPSEDIEKESKHLLEHHKGADKEAAKLYVERALVRQKVLDILQAQK